MSGNLLSLVGLAKKAGRLEVGEEPVGAAARARHARLILVATDAADNTCRRAAHFAQAGNVPWVRVPFTKAQLGAALGRSTCAMAAFTDVGLASSMAAKLSALDSETYGELAQALSGKAQKALERQKEQRAHEKKLQKNKKPWAPPSAEQRPQRPRPDRSGGPARTYVKKGPAPKGGTLTVKGKLSFPSGPRKKP